MDLLKQIVKWLEDKQIFQRERKSNEQRALGMLLYNAGLSYNKAGLFVNASYEAVREWLPERKRDIRSIGRDKRKKTYSR